MSDGQINCIGENEVATSLELHALAAGITYPETWKDALALAPMLGGGLAQAIYILSEVGGLNTLLGMDSLDHQALGLSSAESARLHELRALASRVLRLE
ncbi:MAG: hypothetical protein Q8O00_15885 [Holophaga sp.]|nr:hypothetical protein [Holophaga sp.]